MEKNDDGSPFDLVEERVKTILIKQLRLCVKEITLDSTFEKLEIDSLDRVELMIALEDDFNIEIADAEAEERFQKAQEEWDEFIEENVSRAQFKKATGYKEGYHEK